MIPNGFFFVFLFFVFSVIIEQLLMRRKLFFFYALKVLTTLKKRDYINKSVKNVTKNEGNKNLISTKK